MEGGVGRGGETEKEEEEEEGKKVHVKPTVLLPGYMRQ